MDTDRFAYLGLVPGRKSHLHSEQIRPIRSTAATSTILDAGERRTNRQTAALESSDALRSASAVPAAR